MRLSRIAPPVLVCTLALALAPGASAGQTYCVHEPAACAGAPAPTIQAALDAAAAAPGRDRVEVGLAGGPSEPIAIAPGNAVDVVGVNSPLLVLEGSATVVVQEPSAVVSGIMFAAFGATAGPPLDVAAGTLQDVRVLGSNGGPGIRLGNATLRRVDQDLALDGGTGVLAVGPGGVIEDSTVFGDHGLVSQASGLVVRRSRVAGAFGETGAAAAEVRAGSATFSDSVIDTHRGAIGMVGLRVDPGAGSAAATLLRSTVLAGADAQLTSGVRADCAGGGTATVQLADTAVFGFGVDLERAAPGCAVALDHVRYGTRDAHGGAFADGPGVSSGPVGPFGDFSPGFGSPLVDAGGAAAAAPTQDDRDRLGAPRTVDGDGDGVEVRDVGAVEYQRRPPAALVNGVDERPRGMPVTFDANGTNDPDPADAGRLTYAWSVDGVPTPGTGVELSWTFATTGRHTVGLTVTDPAGLRSTAERAIRITGGPVLEDPTPPPVVDPLPRPPGPGVSPAPEPATVSARLLTRRLGRAGGPLRVRVTCRQATTCRGRLVVTAGTGTGIPLTRVGTAAFAVRRGHPATVAVRVSAAARRLLRHGPAKGTPVTIAVLKASGRRWTSGQGGRVRT